MINDPWFRILSPEVQVFWAGWESTLATLHQNGWEVSTEEDMLNRRVRIFLRNKRMDCVAIGALPKEVSYFMRPGIDPYAIRYALTVNLTMYKDIYLMEPIPSAPITRPVNPFPEYTDKKLHSLKDMKIFRDEDTVAEHEVFIEKTPIKEPTVLELLQLALEKQQPEQERIRKEELRKQSALKLNIRMVA